LLIIFIKTKMGINMLKYFFQPKRSIWWLVWIWSPSPDNNPITSANNFRTLDCEAAGRAQNCSNVPSLDGSDYCGIKLKIPLNLKLFIFCRFWHFWPFSWIWFMRCVFCGFSNKPKFGHLIMVALVRIVPNWTWHMPDFGHSDCWK
jgi:hypothetical protein